MAQRMSDKYELYLFHLLVGIAYEEANDLARFGIPPIGVSRARSFKKDLQEKILPLLTEIDEVVREACLEMIKESIPDKDDPPDAISWMKTIVNSLKMRSSLLLEAYGKDMEKARTLLDEIDGLLDGKRDEPQEY